MFPWIEHYSRVVRNQLAHSNISSGKKTILINTFANIDNFLFKRICNLRLVTGSQKIGPLIMFFWFKLFSLIAQFYQLGFSMQFFYIRLVYWLFWTKIVPQRSPSISTAIDQNKTEVQVKRARIKETCLWYLKMGASFAGLANFSCFMPFLHLSATILTGLAAIMVPLRKVPFSANSKSG